MNKFLYPTLFAILATAIFWYSRHSSEPIINDHKLIVGTNAEYPPFSFIKDEEIVGFDIDIAREVSKRMGKEMELKDMPFEMLLPQIQLGEIQIIAAGMTVTPERQKRVIFTRPYLTNDPLLIVSPANNPPFHDVQELSGKEVVVNDGYTADSYISEIEGPIVRRLATPAEAILALRSHRADAYVTARSAIKPFFDRYGASEFRVVEIPNITDNYSLIISRHYPFLLCQVQTALDAMEKDGTLATLKEKWSIE